MGYGRLTMLKITPTAIHDVLVVEPKVFGDERGYFLESFNERAFAEATQTDYSFVQDNHSHSSCGVLRGLHFQIDHPQGKLVRVVQGAVFDVAVDLRRRSATYGEWVGVELSATNRKQLWIPPGFAHGFLVLSPSADFLYKTTDYYFAGDEQCLRWDDPSVGIAWPSVDQPLVLSEKDRAGVQFRDSPSYEF